MTKGQSLQASSQGIKKAQTALVNHRLTQLALAKELGVTRQRVGNFFGGKPVIRNLFVQICARLNLNWEEVVAQTVSAVSTAAQPSTNKHNINALVQKLRQQIRSGILKQCGVLQLLNTSQPTDLSSIYTHVNILEKVSGRQRLKISDLLEVSTIGEYERPALACITQERVAGLEVVQKYPRLMVIGKPGCGKTTFLKYVAMQCSLGEIKAEQVPIHVTFRDFAQTEQHLSLLEYITKQFLLYGVTNTTDVEQLLLRGKALILLDGLDEIKETDVQRVLQKLQDFITQFGNNHFIISSRIAAREYTLGQFIEVEIADFDSEQIASFANQWFQARDSVKAERFLQKLKANSPVQELANSPLLLTLLCLVFEESADFSTNRAELYEEGLAVLLKKWDAQRNIEREQVYKELSIRHKEDLLTQIAQKTFERGDYFFSQQEIEQYIIDYIRNFPTASNEPESLQKDSRAVLKSIETQHGLLVERAAGIYSFSHLTFQEYFMARAIVSSVNPQALEQALQALVKQISAKPWREVFLLTAGMLRNAEYLLLLMKQQTDQLIAQDQYLQEFLIWVEQKSRVVTLPYKSVSVRAFYFDINLTIDLVFVSANLALDLAVALAKGTLDLNLAFDLAFSSNNLAFALALALNRTFTLALALEFARGLTPDGSAAVTELKQSLQQLKEQIPVPDQDRESFKQWWQTEGQAWTEKLRAAIISLRNACHNWNFTNQQREVLRQYYDANQLLIDCLDSDCYLTRAVRDQIEESLLLPTTKTAQ